MTLRLRPESHAERVAACPHESKCDCIPKIQYLILETALVSNISDGTSGEEITLKNAEIDRRGTINSSHFPAMCPAVLNNLVAIATQPSVGR